MESNDELNPGVTREDVEELEKIANTPNPLNGLHFVQSIVMAFPILEKMKHLQISIFHDEDGNVRLFYDVVDVSKIHVPKSDNP